VKLTVIDLTGKEIQHLISGKLTSGKHQIEWNAGGLNEGIYFIRLKTNVGSIVQKVVVLK